MFLGLSTFGKDGQETMSPDLSAFGKQCFLVYQPLGKMVRKQYVSWFVHFWETCMVRK